MALIKPQFEVEKDMIAKGGIVRDKKNQIFAVERVIKEAEKHGLYLEKLDFSPIKGGKGNSEYISLFGLEKKDNAKYNVLLTLKGNENRYAKLLYKQYSSLKTITFGGLLSYEEVYEKYNKIDCLIFPSKLETWGLPISEFMAFDKPMLIADLPYAHETAAGAKYVAFFNPDTPKMLADRMSEVINGDLFNFSSVPLVNIELPHVTSWKMLFDKLLVDND